jgi:hypothetical protein
MIIKTWYLHAARQRSLDQFDAIPSRSQSLLGVTAASNASSWSPRSLNPLQSIIDIEKSRLPSHRIISDPSVAMESEMRRIGEVLRSIQVVEHGIR